MRIYSKCLLKLGYRSKIRKCIQNIAAFFFTVTRALRFRSLSLVSLAFVNVILIEDVQNPTLSETH